MIRPVDGRACSPVSTERLANLLSLLGDLYVLADEQESGLENDQD
jgi:hypothetical protein